MSSRRITQQPAWVLHRRGFRETSLLLDVLTPEFGRVSLVARGGRGGRGGSALQPLRPLRIDFLHKPGLGTLTAYEADGPALDLRDLALWSAFYVNELGLRLAPAHDDAHTAALFSIYVRSLMRLRHGPPAPVLRAFEYAWLSLLGYGLSGEDVNGEPLTAGRDYRWMPGQGLQVARGGVPGAAVIALIGGEEDERIVATRSLLSDMLGELIDPASLQTARMLRELTALRQRAGPAPAAPSR